MFPDLPEGSERKLGEPTSPQEVRVVRPVRNQIQFLMQDLDATVPEDHQARVIWDFLDRLDLSAFYASIQAVQGGPGRPASDPQVLLALWVLATVEGLGSARKLGRLCREHDAFRWLCGGVPVDYHLLSDFRREHQKALDELLTQILATLMAENLVTLGEVAQDGLRVRASAGSGSFRRKRAAGRVLGGGSDAGGTAGPRARAPRPRGQPTGAGSAGTGGTGAPETGGTGTGSTAGGTGS